MIDINLNVTLRKRANIKQKWSFYCWLIFVLHSANTALDDKLKHVTRNKLVRQSAKIVWFKYLHYPLCEKKACCYSCSCSVNIWIREEVRHPLSVYLCESFHSGSNGNITLKCVLKSNNSRVTFTGYYFLLSHLGVFVWFHGLFALFVLVIVVVVCQFNSMNMDRVLEKATRISNTMQVMCFQLFD